MNVNLPPTAVNSKGLFADDLVNLLVEAIDQIYIDAPHRHVLSAAQRWAAHLRDGRPDRMGNAFALSGAQQLLAAFRPHGITLI